MILPVKAPFLLVGLAKAWKKNLPLFRKCEWKDCYHTSSLNDSKKLVVTAFGLLGGMSKTYIQGTQFDNHKV
jgi:hypothetical protein